MNAPINKSFETEEFEKAKKLPGILTYVAYVGSGKKADYRLVCSDREALEKAVEGLSLLKQDFETEIRPRKKEEDFVEVVKEYFLGPLV